MSAAWASWSAGQREGTTLKRGQTVAKLDPNPQGANQVFAAVKTWS